MELPTPSLRRSTRGRSARCWACVAALAFVAGACGGDSDGADNVAGGDPIEVADGGTTVGSATFTRGEAELPRDLCAGDGQLVSNVLRLEDLAAAGLPVGPEVSAGVINDPSGFSDTGRAACSTQLGRANLFFLYIQPTQAIGSTPDGDSEVREQRTIAGQELTVYRTIEFDQGDDLLDLLTWVAVPFPDEDGGDGAATFWIGYNSIGDEGELSEDEVTDALIAIGELVVPLVTFNPPAAAGTDAEVPDPASGPTTPPWWFGCDTDNFVLKGFSSDAMFAAIDESSATSVGLDDNPLGGLFTECRASNGTTRLSVAAVPPIGGLIESVDTILVDEADAEEQTIAGQRTAAYSVIEGLTNSGVVHLNMDGFSIIVTAKDRDERGLSAGELKALAVAAAEAFLGQI